MDRQALAESAAELLNEYLTPLAREVISDLYLDLRNPSMDTETVLKRADQITNSRRWISNSHPYLLARQIQDSYNDYAFRANQKPE